jgi:hypothetical protein
MMELMRPLFPLAACLLTACAATTAPAPPTAGPSPETPGAAATPAAASGAPAIQRSLPPPNYPSPRASVAPRPSANTIGVTVTGTVFSDQDLELYNATVSIQSLEPKKPFSFRVKAPKGVYTIAGVPPGVMAKVTAVMFNYEPRTQMVTFVTPEDDAPYRLDFKGPYALPKL